MSKLTNFTVDKERFIQLKDSYVRGLKNFNKEQPSQHAIYFNDVLLSDTLWTKSELIEELDDLTAEAVQVQKSRITKLTFF